jgi:signal peptidase I
VLPLRSLARSFDWSGTATRKEFAAYLALLIVAGAASFLAALRLETGPVHRWALPLLTFALLYPGWMSVSVRRMHDMGRSGWWILLGAVPLVGLVLLLVQLAAPARRARIGRFSGRPAYAVGAGASLLVALLIASRVLWQPFLIPSGAMKPTLLVNDYITVAKPFRQALSRGEVIVFRHPTNGQNFVKRLIGLPGDTIQMKDGRLFLNGTAVPTQPAGEFTETYEPQGPEGRTPVCRNAPVGMGGTCRADRQTETLPGAPPHDVIDIGTFPFDDTDVFTVPQGHVFVLGDNRDNSQDSRMPVAMGGMGFIPEDHVIGPVRRVIFSSSGRYWWQVWHLRPDRFLLAVR